MKFSRAIKLFKLTPREGQVAERLGRGTPRKQIADELKIQVCTVDYFMERLRFKTACRSSFELVCTFSHYLPVKNRQ
jgi:DNA-binding NarL/FixJ family response regulator